MLHHDNDHIALAVLAAKCGNPGMVALGIFHFGRSQAAVAAGHLELDHLGCAGLAAHVGIFARNHMGRAQASCLAHGVDHKVQGFLACRHPAAHLAGRVLKQLRLEQIAAIEQGRHINRHLHWRNQGIALADGNVESLAAHPGPLEATFFPLLGWHKPGLFMRQVNACGCPKAGGLGELLNLVNAHALGHEVIIDIAGVDERAFHVHAAVAALFPAAENLVAKLHLARAKHCVARIDAALKKHGCHEQLPHRARRIDALNDTVLERITVVGAKRFPVAGRNAASKKIVVIGRRSNERPKLSCIRLHDHHTASLAIEGVPGGALQIAVERKAHFSATSRLFAQGLAQGAGMGINLHVIKPFAAAQILFQLELQALLAHKVAQGQRRVGFHLFFIGFSHIAEHMGKKLVFRIAALGPDHYFKPWPGVNFRLNARHQIKINVRDHQDRLKGLHLEAILLVFLLHMRKGHS